MKADKLFGRWHGRYLRCLKRQEALRREARRAGDVEAVHDLRVAIRRLRLLVRLASPFIGRAAGEEYGAWSRGLSEATSALRDHDVVLEWLEAQPELASVAERLRANRARLWRRCRPRLRPLPCRLRRSLAAFRTPGKIRRRFSARYSRRFARLLGRVRPHFGDYFRMSLEDRHAFRRRLRQLRYLRELILPEGRQAQDPLLQLLIVPQAAMGEVQNLRLVGDLVEPRLAEPVRARVRALLARQTRDRERQIRQGLQALAAELRDRA
jgi:triphosphatase